MLIGALLPKGSGAIVAHATLAARMPGYRLHAYNPWLSLFPPLLWSLRDPGAQIIHTVQDYGLFFARRDQPLVLTAQNYVLDRFMRQYSSPLQRLHYATDLRWFTRRSLVMADAVTAVSGFTADVLRSDLNYTGAIEVIPNCVDSERFRPRARPQDGVIRVLFSGNPSLRKGIQWLRGIAKRLQPGIRILCATGLRGDGNVPAAAAIEPLGSVSYEEMPTLYNSVDMLLMPTVREGMSLAVLEAMSSGLPVVASDCSSLPEQVHHGRGGLLCPIGDEVAFADAINQLAGDAGLRRVMGEYNRTRIEEEFQMETMVRRYAELFERVYATWRDTRTRAS